MRGRRTASESAAAGAARDINGAALARMLAAGADALRRQSAALDAINVYPVPDGDTGANMSSTTAEAVAALAAADERSVASVAKAAARGALMGAKGNSGVILSQILAGFAALDDHAPALDAPAIAAGLERGRDAAYAAITQPREGTILTAIAAAAEGARTAADAGASAGAALASAVDAARDAVARTPDLLPVLKEAGVVDAGAQGLYIFLDGALRALLGEGAPAAAPLGAIDPAWLLARRRMHDDGAHEGFCTEFVIEGRGLDDAAIREWLRASGDSVLLVGGEDLLHAHVHARDPQAVLAHARTLGDVSREKVEDMQAQFATLRRDAPATTATASGVAVVAVVAGGGLEALFRSLGASVVRGGQTMNPSVGEIRAAIEATGASSVIVLPNNANVVLAAQQAADGLAASVSVLETRSVPQGVAALVAMNPEEPREEIVAAMDDAIAATRSGEVTRAARATQVGGIDVREGQSIALVDGELIAGAETIAAAVAACVARMLAGRAEGDAALVTLYYGEEEDAASAERIAGDLRSRFGAEVEIVEGGQPHYAYLIGVE